MPPDPIPSRCHTVCPPVLFITSSIYSGYMQPCLVISLYCTCTAGVAIRQCNEDGNWNTTIDISNCLSENFVNLGSTAVSHLNVLHFYFMAHKLVINLPTHV